MHVRRGVVLVGTLFAWGCGGEDAPLEDASTCSAGWQPMGPAQPYDVTSGLVYRDGTLYYSTYNARSILALPVTTAQPTVVVAEHFGRHLWLEGDRLLFVSDNNSSNLVYGVPVTGGTPELVLDAHADRTAPEWPVAWAITPTEIFWTEGSPLQPAPPTSVWHASRSGGTPSRLASLSARLPQGDVLVFSNMAVGSDAVVLASISGVASAVPLDGSPIRTLATDPGLGRGHGSFAGIDAAGVYWSARKPGARESDDQWIVLLAPVDGSPVRAFWQGLPPHSAVWDMWPDGAGGWIVVAGQLFADRRSHATVWLIDANGPGRRVACSPDGGGDAPHVQVQPVLAPDAVYLIDSASTFQIVRIPR